MTSVLDALEVRATWERVPLRAIAQKVSECGFGHLQPLSVYLEAGVVPRASRSDNHNQLGEDMEKYQRVVPDDLVFNKLRTWQGGFGVSRDEGVVSPAYIIVRPNQSKVSPRFLGYLLKSAPYLAELTRLSKWMPPSQFDISWESIRDLQLVLPTIDEQSQIADYLDSQTSVIDALIEKKSSELDQVSSYFDAIVREKILGEGSNDLEAPGWADRIGADRKLIPLGNLVCIRGEKNNPIQLTQVLSLTASRGVILYEDKGAIGNVASEDVSRYSIVRKNDLVVNCMNIIIGSVGLSQYEGVLSPVYYVLKKISHDSINIEYLAFHFRIREFQRQLIKIGYGILDHRMRIPWINLKAESIIVPPMHVQEALVAELKAVDSDRAEALSHIENSIALLKEYKSALVTAAVTGVHRVSKIGEL
jgi:type I restriction enzyme S subunit